LVPRPLTANLYRIAKNREIISRKYFMGGGAVVRVFRKARVEALQG
jgi:hypothetical protein